MRPRLMLVVAALFLGGCTAVPDTAPPTDLQVIPGVPPFAEQSRRDDCAGVALASLLAHAGISVPAEAVDAAVYDRRLGGALLADLENYAAAAGAVPRSGRGSLDELRQRLASGRPVLVPIDLGFAVWRRPHYVVVFGYGARSVYLHLRAGQSVEMADAEFERRWSAMGRLFLYLEPRG